MAAITAAMVKELREMTGAGMMDCKKALGETDGDIDKAVDYLSVLVYKGQHIGILRMHKRTNAHARTILQRIGGLNRCGVKVKRLGISLLLDTRHFPVSNVIKRAHHVYRMLAAIKMSAPAKMKRTVMKRAIALKKIIMHPAKAVNASARKTATYIQGRLLV